MSDFFSTISDLDKFSFVVGETEDGHPLFDNITRANHIAVSGVSGTGKSMFVHSLLVSLIKTTTPDDVRFVIFDTNTVEYSAYNRLQHLYIPIVDNHKKFKATLDWLSFEQQKRIKAMASIHVSDIDSFREKSDAISFPRIVIVIDELQSLISVNREAVSQILDILTKARETGFHFVLVTQAVDTKDEKDLVSQISNRIVFASSSKSEFRFLTSSTSYIPLALGGDAIYCKRTQNIRVKTLVPDSERLTMLIDGLNNISL